MFRYVCGRAARTALVILSALLVSACGRNNDVASLPEPNGRLSAVTSEYPAVVLVQAPASGGICTGTFIAERAVLTAAHCTKSAGSYKVFTAFGTYSTSTKVSFGPGVVEDPRDLTVLLFDRDIASRSKGQIYNIGNEAREGQSVRLVGFGCNDIRTRGGSGTKRTGTNVIYNLTSYIEFLSPLDTTTDSGRRIGGPQNVAYSCFGDSGGPALAGSGNNLTIVGVTHAGGQEGDYQVSEYVDLVNRSDNRNFLRQVSDAYDLGVVGL